MDILVIGNGFDLAHGLPTTYSNFFKFCKIIRNIYTLKLYPIGTSLEVFKEECIDGIYINDEIKQVLLNLYEKRQLKVVNNVNDISKVTTGNIFADEFFTYIEKNIWLNYKNTTDSRGVTSWSAFEESLKKVVEDLYNSICNNELGNSIGSLMYDVSGEFLRKHYWGYRNDEWNNQFAKTGKAVRIPFSKIRDELYNDLVRLVRALEIYLSEFVEKLSCSHKSLDIEEICPDKILCFNFIDTYTKVYKKNKIIEYDFIHGKADLNNTIKSNNMVLGIDEFLPNEKKDSDIDLIMFKKFYQRIYKQTGSKYKN